LPPPGPARGQAVARSRAGIALNAVLRELRQAVRAILARPAFSALIVGVLAAGLACVIMMFVMVDTLLLKPLPFAQPEQLLQAGIRGDGELGDILPVSDQDLLQIRRRLAAVADTAAVARSTINLSDMERPERFHGGHVTAGVIWLLSLLAIDIKRGLKPKDALNVDLAALYWHFVDVVWIAIFTLVYLIK